MADEDYESEIESVSDSESESGKKSAIPKKALDEDDISDVGDEDDESEDGDEDDESELDEDIENISENGNDNPVMGITNFDADLEEDEDEDDDDENYLQKFSEGIQKKVIEEYHPELVAHNTEEIEAMSKVVRDPNGLVIDPFHKTIPILSRYEKARILGERAKQLNAGAQPFIELDETMIDGYLIALKELEQKKIPFIVQRPLPDGGCEYWSLRDLEIL